MSTDDSDEPDYPIPTSPASSDFVQSVTTIVADMQRSTRTSSKSLQATDRDDIMELGMVEEDSVDDIQDGDDIDDSSNLSFSITQHPGDNEASTSSLLLCSDDLNRLNCAYRRSYEILHADELLWHMQHALEETKEILGISRTSTRLLLHHFRWDKTRLLERFFDLDSQSLQNEFGILLEHCYQQQQHRHHHHHQQQQKETNISCCICYCEEDNAENIMSAQCGHTFCRQCGFQYIKQKIMEDGVGTAILCPGHQCEIFIDDELIINLSGLTELGKELVHRYNRAITNSFVECNRDYRWCPGAGCDMAVKKVRKLSEAVKCSCGMTYCFECGSDWHEPVDCYWLNKWIKRCKDDSETSNWLAANTKECPRCQACIEKAGGCNHVICRNTSCKHEFCWVCLGPWEPHGATWYSCTSGASLGDNLNYQRLPPHNRFNEADARKAQTAQERSRSALLRYLHYYNRYVNHLHSLRIENKLKSIVRRKMEELQTAGNSWIEVQFLQKGVSVLLKCRQMLMYTYAFAFYLKRNNQSDVFERNQADLERATEELSEHLERDLSRTNISTLKKQVQDSYRYCDSRRSVLLAHVKDGYENDYWEYQMNL